MTENKVLQCLENIRKIVTESNSKFQKRVPDAYICIRKDDFEKIIKEIKKIDESTVSFDEKLDM